MNLLKVGGKIKYGELLSNIIIPLLIGILSSTLAKGSMGTYESINLPKYALPGYLFPIFWIAKYIPMGFASYRVKLKGMTFKDKGLKIYWLSLLANFLWPLLFFNLNSPIVALFDAIILLILVIMTLLEYKKFDKLAAYMFFPYILWLMYICILNASFIKI